MSVIIVPKGVPTDQHKFYMDAKKISDGFADYISVREFAWAARNQLRTAYRSRDQRETSALYAYRQILTLFVDNNLIDIEKALVLLARKQNDYGPGNILETGHLGLLVRMLDKTNRLIHLTSDKMEGNPTIFESIEDTLLDIYNYCIIGVMLIDGVFPTDTNNEEETVDEDF